MPEEKPASSFFKWCSGILAAIIGGLVLFSIENYQTPGVALHFEPDEVSGHLAATNVGVASVRVTAINKSVMNLHSCHFWVNASRAGDEILSPDELLESVRADTKEIEHFELGPHEAKERLLTPQELNMVPDEGGKLEFLCGGACEYYMALGQRKNASFDIPNQLHIRACGQEPQRPLGSLCLEQGPLLY